MPSKRFLPVFAGVLALALAGRLWVLSRFGGSVYFLPSSGDMKFYADWGRLFAAGQGVGSHAFYGLPGYPFLLGGVFALAGFSPYSVAFLQTLLDVGTAALLFFMAAWACPGPRARGVGGLAALGWVFVQPAQALSLLCMPTTWGVLAFCAFVVSSVVAFV